MDLERALDRIETIHRHLDKNETCRGLRALPVALTGLVGLAAVPLAARWIPAPAPRAFVGYWIWVAAINILLAGALLGRRYLRDAEEDRRRTRRVLGRMLPSFVLGALATAGVLRADLGAGLLPGAWAGIFGLGLLAARENLPSAIESVGWFYLLAGGATLYVFASSAAPPAWTVGALFGTGQLATAAVLHRAEEARA